jgi:hypothetical protein
LKSEDEVLWERMEPCCKYREGRVFSTGQADFKWWRSQEGKYVMSEGEALGVEVITSFSCHKY